jgi:hypothetical protein
VDNYTEVKAAAQKLADEAGVYSRITKDHFGQYASTAVARTDTDLVHGELVRPSTMPGHHAIPKGVKITFTTDSDPESLRSAAEQLLGMSGSEVAPAGERDQIAELESQLNVARAITAAREAEGSYYVDEIEKLKSALDGAKRDNENIRAELSDGTGRAEPDLAADIKAFDISLACGDIIKVKGTNTAFTADLPGECHVMTVPPPPPPPSPELAPKVPVDSAGVAWNAELHTSGQTKKMDGTWKARPRRGGSKPVTEAPKVTGAQVQNVIGALLAAEVPGDAIQAAMDEAAPGGVKAILDGADGTPALKAIQALALLNGVTL